MSSRIYASVTPKNAKFNSKQNASMLTALSGLYSLIKSWTWVANSAGQASQRTPSWDVVSKVKVVGRKNLLTVEMPIGFQIAYNPANGSQLKGDMTRWLTALKIGKLENFPRVAELYAEHLTFFGYKMMTSQTDSREGCLMAVVLNHLEKTANGKLDSIAWGNSETRNREDIESAMEYRIDFSTRAIEGDFWREKKQTRESTRSLDGIKI